MGSTDSKDCLKNLVVMVYELHEMCFQKLKECYKEEIILPIDIKKVAEHLGVKIEYDSLNIGSFRRVDRNIAQLTYEKVDDKVGYKILVDQSENGSGRLSNLEKYAVAYELGKIIVNKEDTLKVEEIKRLNMRSNPYSLPRLSAQLENFTYEMCAMFLLLPMDLFLHEFKDYLDKNDHPVVMDDWIKHLSKITEIPNYQLVNGYQYIKFCAYQYYMENLAEDEIKGTDYRDLFN